MGRVANEEGLPRSRQRLGKVRRGFQGQCWDVVRGSSRMGRGRAAPVARGLIPSVRQCTESGLRVAEGRDSIGESNYSRWLL
jgi:hypothetical protein